MNPTLTIRRALDVSEAYIRSNQRTILTSSAVTGVAMTAYLSARAAFKAAKTLSEASPEPATLGDKARLVWTHFIPPTVVGVTTVGAIVLSHKIDTRKIAALTAAYSLTERALDEYKDKIAEMANEKGLKEIQSAIAKDKVDKEPPQVGETEKGSGIVIYSESKVLCCELYTMRYFWCDIESLRKAENKVNASLANGDMHVFISEFYHEVGLENTAFAFDFGWAAERPLKLHFSTTMTPDGRPCITFEYNYIHHIDAGCCP